MTKTVQASEELQKVFIEMQENPSEETLKKFMEIQRKEYEESQKDKPPKKIYYHLMKAKDGSCLLMTDNFMESRKTWDFIQTYPDYFALKLAARVHASGKLPIQDRFEEGDEEDSHA